MKKTCLLLFLVLGFYSCILAEELSTADWEIKYVAGTMGVPNRVEVNTFGFQFTLMQHGNPKNLQTFLMKPNNPSYTDFKKVLTEAFDAKRKVYIDFKILSIYNKDEDSDNWIYEIRLNKIAFSDSKAPKISAREKEVQLSEPPQITQKENPVTAKPEKEKLPKAYLEITGVGAGVFGVGAVYVHNKHKSRRIRFTVSSIEGWTAAGNVQGVVDPEQSYYLGEASRDSGTARIVRRFSITSASFASPE